MHDTQRLLRLAYRTASRIVHNPLLAEEAGERAVHRLQLAILAGQGPDRPEAWIRTVARRSACAILRNGWSHVQQIHNEPVNDEEGVERRGRLRDELRSVVGPALTRRQRDALEAALACRTTRDAAKTCNMEPRDFRRYLDAISRRARQQMT